MQTRLSQEASGKKVRIVVDNKLKGAYAESDLDKGTIRVNVKKHSDPSLKRINPLPNGNENLASTIEHEKLHFQHPNKGEMAIRRLEKKKVARMSQGQQNKLISKLH